MGIRFTALGKMERAAVAAYVRGEYDKLIFQQPNSYVSKNAQTDPEQWQGALRELIAGDAKRVQAIVEAANRSAAQSGGFTLVELSMVLVIIGLIVGGVLVGQDLIRAAAVRAQISQIEKYNTAARTFYDKYSYLPGDIKDPEASQFGFAARGQFAGEGDGNGVIEGVSANAAGANGGTQENAGETVMFWVDLSTAHLIEGSFSSGSPTVLQAITVANGYLFYPAMAINNAGTNYAGIVVYSFGGTNYFGTISAAHATTVRQAYAIDAKIDDGLPQSGRIVASGPHSWSTWGWSGVSPGTAAAPSTTTCYDNQNNASNVMSYSIGQNGGAGVNCDLTFSFQ